MQLYRTTEEPMAKPPNLTDLSWLDELSFEETARLFHAVEASRDAKRAEAAAEFRRKAEQEAEKLGISLADFFRPAGPTNSAPQPKSGKGVSTLPPKYVDKATGRFWSGKGRMASWLKDLQNAGKDPADYINPSWIAAKGGS